jgi:hypothetical protein
MGTRTRRSPPSRLIVPRIPFTIVRTIARFRIALRRRFRQDERAYAVGLTLAVGAWGACVAVAVRYAGLAVQWIVLHDAHEPLRAARALGLPMIVVIPAIGGLVYGLLVRLFRTGAGGEGTSRSWRPYR